MIAFNNNSEYMMKKLISSKFAIQPNLLALKEFQVNSMINKSDIFGMTPLMLALKNNKNGSIVRLKNNGARLRQTQGEDLDEIGFDLLQAAEDGDYMCFMKYQKAGFIKFDSILNIEGKSLAHLVSLNPFNSARLT
jgi:hypothetical protein